MKLQTLLKDAEENVKIAAARALNEAAEQLEKDIRANMTAVGIRDRTGRLRGSIELTKATPKKLSVRVKSEVYSINPRTGQKAIVKRPGLRNPAMRGRYKNGVPYGRILEFSPRFSKYNGFFYGAYYKNKNRIKNEIMEKIGNAWNS